MHIRHVTSTVSAWTACVCARRAGRALTAVKWTATPCSVYPTVPIKALSVSNCTNAFVSRDGRETTVPNRRAESIAAATVDVKPALASVTRDGQANSVRNDSVIYGKHATNLAFISFIFIIVHFIYPLLTKIRNSNQFMNRVC